MKISITRYLLAAMVALGITATIAARPRNAIPAADDIRKAEYTFLESANYRADDQLTDYYMLLRHAAALNPSDIYLKGALAELDIQLATDSGQLMPAYQRLKQRFYARPLEPHYAQMFTRVASLLSFYDDELAAWQLLDSLQPSRTDPAMNIARIYEAKGMHLGDTALMRRAVDIYNRLQETQPGNVSLAGRKISTLANLTDTVAVIEEVERLRAAAPLDAQVLVLSAAIYQAIAMPDSALACLDKIVALYPDNGAARNLRVQLFAAGTDTARFINEMELALQSPSLEYGQKYDLLLRYLGQYAGDSAAHSTTEHLFGIFQEANPGEATLHSLYGEYLGSNDRYAEAAEQYRYSVDLDPSDEDVWNNLIQACARMDDADSTDVLLNTSLEAFRRFPTDIYASLIAASSLSQKNRDAEAIAVLDSVRFLPNHNRQAISRVYTFKADLMAKQNMVDSALANYEIAIARDADNYMALNNAAYYMAEHTDDLSRAQIYASIACAAEPDNPTFLDTYAWVMFKRRDYPRALELIDRTLEAASSALAVDSDSALEVDPDSEVVEVVEVVEDDATVIGPEIYEHAGDIYFMNGRPNEAVEFWRQALGMNPDNELLQRKVNARAYYYE